MIIGMLRQPHGATLKSLMQAAQWQAHSACGFLSAQLVKTTRASAEILLTERGGPALTLGNTNLGKLTASSATGRQLQFGLKLLF